MYDRPADFVLIGKIFNSPYTVKSYDMKIYPVKTSFLNVFVIAKPIVVLVTLQLHLFVKVPPLWLRSFVVIPGRLSYWLETTHMTTTLPPSTCTIRLSFDNLT